MKLIILQVVLLAFGSINTNGQWADICEECQDMMQYKQGTATAAEDFAELV